MFPVQLTNGYLMSVEIVPSAKVNPVVQLDLILVDV